MQKYDLPTKIEMKTEDSKIRKATIPMFEKIVEKIDMLLDQNKIIARGLTLLHEPSLQISSPMPQQFSPQPRQLMPQRMPTPQQMRPLPRANTGEYQKSAPAKKTSETRLGKSKKNENPFG